MSDKAVGDLRSRVLSFWWTAELFSPQSIPRTTNSTAGPDDRRVVQWQPGQQLPWEYLPPPRRRGKQARVWQHTVYLGVYQLQDTFEVLHEVFADDRDAYQERPGQESACAGLLVDHRGLLVPGSAVLSSALWAVGQATGQAADQSDGSGPASPGWMDGFDGALKEFAGAVDEHEGRRRDNAYAGTDPASTPDTNTATDADTGTSADPGTDTDADRELGSDAGPEVEGGERLPLDGEAMEALLGIAHGAAGIGPTRRLATQMVRIESKVVFDRSPSEDQVETDFLNSFYLEDLEKVRQQAAAGQVGSALGEYLLGDDEVAVRDRVDVVAEPGVVDAGASVGRLPWGRWPSDPEHPLALSQQFAVNTALNDLAPAAGLLGVNGPPGTGKTTTMLRDMLAGLVTERARRLAALSRAGDAFTGEPHEWNAAGGYPREVRQLRPELTGFEMVVASTNNAAVENVTNEIPTRTAIHKTWQADADYFAAIATKTLAASGPVNPAVPDSASQLDGTATGTGTGLSLDPPMSRG